MKTAPAIAVEQLCPGCGFCCNGNLFADVELQKGDDAARLKRLGLFIEKKSLAKRAFAQSCACFDGKLCAIYPERPARCRTFQCGLLKRVTAGSLAASEALEIIARSKARVSKVARLLRRFDDDDANLALTRRYAQAMSGPIDLSRGADDSQSRGKLMLAMQGLMRQLESDFLEQVVSRESK